MIRKILIFASLILNVYHFEIQAAIPGYPIQGKQTSADENFDQFYKKFNTDKAFQLSRVVFPFKMLFVEDDSSISTKLLEKKEWNYVNLLNKKYIIKKRRAGRSEMIVTLQIQDTGVFVEHIFQENNGKWKLVSTKDSSD
jgi:hypothetical protein